MASLKIYNSSGSEVGTYDLEPSDIAPRISKQLLHDAVVMYQSNLRQGSHKTKTRGEVAGTTKKMYRQKGTGNARAGSRRSGVRRGGGHIHARQPRDYSYRLPRKALQLATRMAVASKVQSNSIVLIDELTFDSPSTKGMAGVIKALNLRGATLLVATAGHDINVYKSTRNIAGVDVSPVTDLNALSVLKPQRLLMTKAAIELLKQRSAEAGKSRADSAEEGGEA